MSMRRFLPRLAMALPLVAAVGWTAAHRGQINLTTLDAWLGSFGPWAPIAYVLLYVLATVAFVPGVVFALAGGALFGPFWGSLWNLAGATLGATFAFLVARYIAGDWVARKAGGLLKRIIDGVDAEGWRFVAFVRLVPLFPFNLSNYVLGLTRIPLAGETEAIRYVLLALGLLAAIALLPRLIRRLRRPFSWIEVGDLKRQFDDGSAVTVIDVRGPDEFIGPLGHIASARNIPIGELPGRLPELAGLEEKSIVLVCRTDKRSAAAGQTLREAGFTHVSVLRRGMEQWHEAGLPVERRAGA
jgi:uncharacterized membrane protein YdjX (TVP38/TMEM64 family)/rhodanese-related sulfurtransferase